MKKIGILTFHHAENYGAVLQAYALFLYIDKYTSVNAEIINYESTEISKRNNQYPFYNIKGKTFKRVLREFFTCITVYKLHKVFAHFRENNLHLSEKVTRNQLEELDVKYDAIICGSDQIWNPQIIKNNTSYYLDFINHTKGYSYAASVGDAQQIKQYYDFFYEQLKKFKIISVREESTRRLLTQLYNFKARTDIDPVFLLDAIEWKKLAKSKSKKKYILIYKMGKNVSGERMMSFAKNLGIKQSLDVILLTDDNRWYKYPSYKHYGVASVEEFLGLISGAEIIVTNSFHATAFSIIFNKHFYVETNIPRAERIENLLHLTGTESQALYSGRMKSSGSAINWEYVNKKIACAANASKEYIYSIIEDVSKND